MFDALPFRAALRCLKSVGLACLVLVALALTGQSAATAVGGVASVGSATGAAAERGAPQLAQQHHAPAHGAAAMLACEQLDEHVDDDLATSFELGLEVALGSEGERSVERMRWDDARAPANLVVLRAQPARGPPA